MAEEKPYDAAVTVGSGAPSGDGSSPAQASGPSRAYHYEMKLPNGTVIEHDSPTQLSRDEWYGMVKDKVAVTLQNAQPSSWQDAMQAVRETVMPFAAETGGMIAGGIAGAGYGAAVGAMGGPLAPITVPIGSLLGGAVGGGLGYVAGRNVGRVGQAGMDATNSAAGGGLYGPGVQYPSPMRTMDMGEFGETFKEGVTAETIGRVAGPLGAGALKSRLGLRPSEFMPAVKRGFGVPAESTSLQQSLERAKEVRGIAQGLPRADVETGQLLVGRESTGVDLTAGQQTGRPFFRWSEGFAMRSPGGRQKMLAFAEEQTQQLQQAGAALQANASGLPPMDVLTRNNRFVNVVRGQLDRTKTEGNRLFDVAYSTIGKDTPVNADNLIAVAKAIRAEQPHLRGEQIGGFGLGPVDEILKKVLGRDTDAEVRALLKLPAGAPLPPGIQVSGGVAQKPISVEEMRTLKNRLVDIAFPDRFAGAATIDSAPVRTARRLIGAIGDDLDAVAKLRGSGAVDALENAKQFWRAQVKAMDGGWYADLLSDKRVLSDMNTRLFNRNDPGVLLDAKKVLSDDGWQLLQQQYIDMLFKESTFIRPETGGAIGFNGKKFAERVLNPRERVVLEALYGPEVVKNLTDFAKVASVASPTTAMAQEQVAGLWLGAGQAAAAAYPAWQGLGQLAAGDVVGATVSAGKAALPFLAPLGMAKVFTNPTATYYLVRAMEKGTLSPETYNVIIRTLIEAGHVKVMLPDNYQPHSTRRLKLDTAPSDLVTQTPGMRGINQTPDSLVTRY